MRQRPQRRRWRLAFFRRRAACTTSFIGRFFSDHRAIAKATPKFQSCLGVARCRTCRSIRTSATLGCSAATGAASFPQGRVGDQQSLRDHLREQAAFRAWDVHCRHRLARPAMGPGQPLTHLPIDERALAPDICPVPGPRERPACRQRIHGRAVIGNTRRSSLLKSGPARACRFYSRQSLLLGGSAARGSWKFHARRIRVMASELPSRAAARCHSAKQSPQRQHVPEV